MYVLTPQKILVHYCKKYVKTFSDPNKTPFLRKQSLLRRGEEVGRTWTIYLDSIKEKLEFQIVEQQQQHQ